MAKIIEFSRTTEPSEIPDYTGRILALNPEKGVKFQCGGFRLSSRRMCAPVSYDAQMNQVHEAILDGRLLDVTDDKDIQTKYSRLSSVKESETDQQAFFGPKSLFLDLNLKAFADITPEDARLEESICVMTSDPEEKKRIQERIDLVKHKLVLPPGMDDPEKYLLKVVPQ